MDDKDISNCANIIWKLWETFNDYLDYENTIERYDGSLICGNVWFAEDENTQPSSIKYLDDVKDMLLRSFISLKSSGGVEFSQIIPEAEFPNPKPFKLIKKLITSIDDPNALILDSFAGSATTAHAVLAANYEDGGNRKFILIEMEDYADEITAERVRRVIEGVPHAKDVFLKQKLGGSFTFCDLGQEMNIENLLKGKELPEYDELARYAFYTATGLTLDDVSLGTDYFIGETKIIDLSADFRLENINIYKENYGDNHTCSEYLNKFIYGLVEFNRSKIANAKNIAVPGCYPTSILLPLIPLLNDNLIMSDNIIIDSKSGYSGAGKNFDLSNIKSNSDYNFYNYNTNSHRHISEIKQELSKFDNDKKLSFSFNPHILPNFRGMMSTIYCNLKNGVNKSDVINIFKELDKKNYFINFIDDAKVADFFSV